MLIQRCHSTWSVAGDLEFSQFSLVVLCGNCLLTKMFLVLHSQKLKQKQVILSTMPGSFLFMFVTPGLSHVGLIAQVPAQWLGFGTQFLNSAFNGSFSFAFFLLWHAPFCVYHIACSTSCSLEHLTWNIFKNEELQENLYHFFCSASWSTTGKSNLDKMMLSIYDVLSFFLSPLHLI